MAGQTSDTSRVPFSRASSTRSCSFSNWNNASWVWLPCQWALSVTSAAVGGTAAACLASTLVFSSSSRSARLFRMKACSVPSFDFFRTPVSILWQRRAVRAEPKSFAQSHLACSMAAQSSLGSALIRQTSSSISDSEHPEQEGGATLSHAAKSRSTPLVEAPQATYRQSTGVNANAGQVALPPVVRCVLASAIFHAPIPEKPLLTRLKAIGWCAQNSSVRSPTSTWKVAANRPKW